MLWTYEVNHSVIDISSIFYRTRSQATLISIIIFKEFRKYLNQEHLLRNNAFISLDNLSHQRNILLLKIKINTS